ncbi:MAG: prepilin-type N-terminal cleavage/methylation domain-containing protein [Fuerstiella sp.]|nr:prepilin-type N-terminal cleavage/methylation domain-containing protein [Fuerstiella sp.]
MRSFQSRRSARNVKQTNRFPSGSSASAHGGYSLMEMLIVLAIMAAMAAFALPSLQGPLDKSRLRSSARQVRAALAKTRAMAIREGAPLLFQFEAGGRSWTIERKGPPSLPFQSASDGALRTPSGLPTGPAANENTPLSFQQSSVLRQGLLPDGVKFSDALPMVDADDPSMFGDDRSGELENGFSGPTTQLVTFRPNGRSEDKTLTIVGNRDFVIEVEVRGLTSAVSCSSPFRALPTAMDDSVAEFSDEVAR